MKPDNGFLPNRQNLAADSGLVLIVFFACLFAVFIPAVTFIILYGVR